MGKSSRESDSTHDEPGFLARLLHLKPRHHSSGHRTYKTADGETFTITCEGCGATSEAELERGHAADNPGVGEGYFSRPCPHCGREMVAVAERRPF
jgi:hypothetical protein